MSKILVEKEIYGWSTKEIAEIIKNDFLTRLPEQFHFIVKNIESFEPEEGYQFLVDEIFDIDDLPEYVKEYLDKEEEPSFLGHVLTIDNDYGYFSIYVVTTFQPRWDDENKLPQFKEDGRDHDNRLMYISLSDEDGEAMFTINFVK